MRFAALLLLGLLSRCERERPLEFHLVYARSVAAGTRLTFQDTRQRVWRDGEPRGSSLDDAVRLSGQVTRAAHAENEPLLAADVEPALTVAKSLRAVRLEGDFGLKLEPGAFVDVLFAHADAATTIVHGALVLRAAAGEVWLSVLPEEAEALTLARANVALTLRAPGDCSEPEESPRTTVNTLLSGDRTRVMCHLPRRGIEIIRGKSTAR